MIEKIVGPLLMSFSSLVLSLEMFFLKLIRGLDKAGRTNYWMNPWYYLREPILLIPFLITIAVFLYGLYLTIKYHLQNRDDS